MCDIKKYVWDNRYLSIFLIVSPTGAYSSNGCFCINVVVCHTAVIFNNRFTYDILFFYVSLRFVLYRSLTNRVQESVAFLLVSLIKVLAFHYRIIYFDFAITLLFTIIVLYQHSG